MSHYQSNYHHQYIHSHEHCHETDGTFPVVAEICIDSYHCSREQHTHRCNDKIECYQTPGLATPYKIVTLDVGSAQRRKEE